MDLDRVRDEFHDALEQVSQQSAFIATSIKVRARSANIFSIGSLDPIDRPVVDAFRAARVRSGDLAFEALYSCICFHFEGFVREIHRAAVVEINARITSPDRISRFLINNHVVATGQIMARYLSDPRASRLDIFSYARNAASCAPGGSNYSLNPDVFTFFSAGASSEQIDRIFHAIGLDINWDVFGRNEVLKRYFQGGGVREVAKQSKKFIEDFVEERNRIVHKGSGYRPISESEIQRTIEFFKPFSAEFTAMIANFCVRYRPTNCD